MAKLFSWDLFFFRIKIKSGPSYHFILNTETNLKKWICSKASDKVIRYLPELMIFLYYNYYISKKILWIAQSISMEWLRIWLFTASATTFPVEENHYVNKWIGKVCAQWHLLKEILCRSRFFNIQIENARKCSLEYWMIHRMCMQKIYIYIFYKRDNMQRF